MSVNLIIRSINQYLESELAKLPGVKAGYLYFDQRNTMLCDGIIYRRFGLRSLIEIEWNFEINGWALSISNKLDCLSEMKLNEPIDEVARHFAVYSANMFLSRNVPDSTPYKDLENFFCYQQNRDLYENNVNGLIETYLAMIKSNNTKYWEDNKALESGGRLFASTNEHSEVIPNGKTAISGFPNQVSRSCQLEGQEETVLNCAKRESMPILQYEFDLFDFPVNYQEVLKLLRAGRVAVVSTPDEDCDSGLVACMENPIGIIAQIRNARRKNALQYHRSSGKAGLGADKLPVSTYDPFGKYMGDLDVDYSFAVRGILAGKLNFRDIAGKGALRLIGVALPELKESLVKYFERRTRFAEWQSALTLKAIPHAEVVAGSQRRLRISLNEADALPYDINLEGKVAEDALVMSVDEETFEAISKIIATRREEACLKITKAAINWPLKRKYALKQMNESFDINFREAVMGIRNCWFGYSFDMEWEKEVSVYEIGKGIEQIRNYRLRSVRGLKENINRIENSTGSYRIVVFDRFVGGDGDERVIGVKVDVDSASEYIMNGDLSYLGDGFAKHREESGIAVSVDGISSHEFVTDMLERQGMIVPSTPYDSFGLGRILHSNPQRYSGITNVFETSIIVTFALIGCSSVDIIPKDAFGSLGIILVRSGFVVGLCVSVIMLLMILFHGEMIEFLGPSSKNDKLVRRGRYGYPVRHTKLERKGYLIIEKPTLGQYAMVGSLYLTLALGGILSYYLGSAIDKIGIIPGINVLTIVGAYIAAILVRDVINRRSLKKGGMLY